MGIVLMRFLFLLSCVTVGYQMSLGWAISRSTQFIGVLIGFVGAILVLSIEWCLKKAPAKGLIAGGIGLLSGLLLATLITNSIVTFPFDPRIALYLRVGLSLSLGYIGMVVAWRKRDEFRILFPQLDARRGVRKYKILDTSVIIDGRIADVAESGFLEGEIIIPKFVLSELQHIADSPDPLKRARGRRGLDILTRMQKSTKVGVMLEERDYPHISEVDSKLIQLAKDLNAKIITNDYNLNKVAKLENVEVLNINELASALRPVILPNEVIKVRIVKEGKEPNQGVAYLEDGTMVVVNEGKHFMGEEVSVEVTSVLQTSAGRMIFGKIVEAPSFHKSRRK
ncbi:MAG TPA: PIN domain-containing protein [bacterium]|nr:PIN domain-containing protein [bacterium]HEX68622.1 PIN domain-containing protein [bacterium]